MDRLVSGYVSLYFVFFEPDISGQYLGVKVEERMQQKGERMEEVGDKVEDDLEDATDDINVLVLSEMCQ